MAKPVKASSVFRVDFDAVLLRQDLNGGGFSLGLAHSDCFCLCGLPCPLKSKCRATFRKRGIFVLLSGGCLIREQLHPLGTALVLLPDCSASARYTSQ